MSEPAPLLVITGPTATGKTAAAIELARRLDGEIVGADSVQVYRGFDIGSGKPTATELGEIRHHLVDVVDPDQPIDAMRYAGLADEAIAAIRARGKRPIVCGGTGLWLRALLRGLVAVPPVDPEVRAAIEREADTHGLEALHARLAEVDPRAAAAIHPNDRVRIVRALEVHAQTGIPMGELRAAHALGAPRHPAFLVVLDVGRDELAERIRARTHAMIQAGWADEVRRLVRRWGRDVRALGSVGYRQMLEHVLASGEGGAAIDATEAAIVKATRIYARRQRTWWKNEPGVCIRTTPRELLSDEGMERICASR